MALFRLLFFSFFFFTLPEGRVALVSFFLLLSFFLAPTFSSGLVPQG